MQDSIKYREKRKFNDQISTYIIPLPINNISPNPEEENMDHIHYTTTEQVQQQELALKEQNENVRPMVEQ